MVIQQQTSLIVDSLPFTEDSYSTEPASVFTTIELSAKEALDPSSTTHGRSISNGIAAVFIEHGRLTPPPPPLRHCRCDSNSSCDSDHNPAPSLRIRKRDKVLKAIRYITRTHPKAPSGEPKKERRHFSDKSSRSSSRGLAVARQDIFPQNLSAPVADTAVPKPDGRIETTPQLALCSMLLAEHTALVSVCEPSEKVVDGAEEPLQELPTDNNEVSLTNSDEGLPTNSTEEWLKAQDHVEQDRINWLISKMVEGFVEDAVKDSTAVAEVVHLGPVLDRELYRKLISCLISEFDQSLILDVELLQGLVQLLQCASPGYLVSDDLIKILSMLRNRLEKTHKRTTEHQYHLVSAVAHVLDVMAEHGVEDLSRVLEHEPLSKVLASLKGSSDPYLMYQASHAFQALQYVPNDESPLDALYRYSLEVADGIVKLSAITQFRLPEVMKGLGILLKTTKESYDFASSMYETASAVLTNGQSVLEILGGGTGYGHQKLWYSAVCAARMFARQGQLAELNQLICQAPCRRDPLFQWGICQLLGEIAADSIWTTTTRQQSIDLLEELYKNDADWGRDECVQDWMVAIVRQLSDSPDDAVKSRALALLQDLNLDQSSVIQHPYPLRNGLAMPTSSPILTKVQDIPYLEYHLRQIQKKRLEDTQTVYIPPQAKASLRARDDDLFPLMEKVQEFLASERQVMLILGDSGSGKSTFNRHLEFNLWTDYKIGGPIPLLINLPAIDRPDQDMIGKHLDMNNFSKVQIQEMKQHREFILICDGYDESLQTANLHKTNLLNQPGQWSAKMVICCRSQYLSLSYHSRFKPLPVDRYNSNNVELFQEAAIVPFSKDQVKCYIEQFSQHPRTKLLFGDRPVWSAEEYLEKLIEIPNLMDLVKNPFLLALSLKALPGLADSNNDLSVVKVTRVGLYDKFAEQWLEINVQRLQDSKLSSEERATLDLLVDDGFIPRAISYLERLAASIFKEQDGNPVVQYSQLSDAGTWKEELFSQDPIVKHLREAGPLNRTGNQYRFIHRTVLEYFYSRVIYSPPKKNAETLSQDLGNNTFDAPQTPPLFDVNGPLFHKSLRKEPSVVQFLCDRTQQNPDFKQQLLDFLELSKTDPTASQAAANAIMILIKSGVLFNSADLRGIRVPDADLSDGQFDYAEFHGADLRDANFTRSWLRCADFSKAQMDGVRFGELPYLSHAYSCAFSFNGSLLAVGLSNDGIAIYDVKTWTKLHSLEGQEQCVLGLAYSPNNSHQVVSGGSDGIVRLWDSVKNELLFAMDGHTGYVTAVAFSSNGENIASASSDQTVRIWSSLTGQLLFTLEGHTAKVTGLAYSPTGQYIASGCSEGTIRLWNANTGAPGPVWPSDPASPILCLAQSSDGQWIASGHKNGEILLRNARTGVIGATLVGHTYRVRGIAFSPNSQWIASASRDHTVRLWDVLAGTLVSVFSGHTADVTALTFSPDGFQVASASEDHTVRLWEVSSSGNSSDIQKRGHTGFVFGVAYSPDGTSIVSCSNDRTVRTWDVSTGAAGSFSLRLASPIQVAAYSPSGQHIVTAGTDDNNITLWSSQTGAATGDVFSGHTEPVKNLVYSPCGDWIVSVSSDRTARLWGITLNGTGTEPGCILASNQTELTAVAFSPSGTHFVIAGTDDFVELWDAQTRQIVATLQGCGALTYDVAFSPRGEQIAIGGSTETLVLWDGKSSTPDVELHGHTDRILCIAYSPVSANGDQWIASGSLDRTVRLWRHKPSDEPNYWTCVSVVKDLAVSCRRIAWNPNPTPGAAPLEFVTGYQDGSVRVWRVVEEKDGKIFRVCLVWNSSVVQLVAVDLTTKGAIGLSNMNRHLLVQRGAVDCH
ncbi:hypothetical protein EC957_009724 [Mortierella hygrophila]|uniref:Intraflagellar transport protein 122 homolog n=1 Tax=Mortierella hygrophila TaxID=979708 RepID=A0A9P6EW66_9FUNG|nr:hypothetical protein EC957_009724 [Mortierella hygrophila]